MKLFNWFKAKILGQHAASLEAPAMTKVAGVIVSSRTTLSEKRCVQDFINFDFSKIKEDDYIDRIVLDNPILGAFNYIDVHTFDNGVACNVDLISHSKKITPELRQFIAFCAKEFGPTKNGEAEITPMDERLLMMGRFSRLWHDVWVDCGPDMENGGIQALRLTLFNVQKLLANSK